MILHNLLHHRKTQSGAVLLAMADERLKQLAANQSPECRARCRSRESRLRLELRSIPHGCDPSSGTTASQEFNSRL